MTNALAKTTRQAKATKKSFSTSFSVHRKSHFANDAKSSRVQRQYEAISFWLIFGVEATMVDTRTMSWQRQWHRTNDETRKKAELNFNSLDESVLPQQWCAVRHDARSSFDSNVCHLQLNRFSVENLTMKKKENRADDCVCGLKFATFVTSFAHSFFLLSFLLFALR